MCNLTPTHLTAQAGTDCSEMHTDQTCRFVQKLRVCPHPLFCARILVCTYLFMKSTHMYFSWTLTGLKEPDWLIPWRKGRDRTPLILIILAGKRIKNRSGQSRGDIGEGQLEDAPRDWEQWGLRRLWDLQGFRMLIFLLDQAQWQAFCPSLRSSGLSRSSVWAGVEASVQYSWHTHGMETHSVSSLTSTHMKSALGPSTPIPLHSGRELFSQGTHLPHEFPPDTPA